MANPSPGSTNQGPASAGAGDSSNAAGERDDEQQDSPAWMSALKRKLSNDNNIPEAGISSTENQTPPSQPGSTAQSTPLNNTVSSQGIKVRRLDEDYATRPSPRPPIRTPQTAPEHSGQVPSSHVHVEAVGTAVFHNLSSPAVRINSEVPGQGSAQMAPQIGFAQQQSSGSNIKYQRQITTEPAQGAQKVGTSAVVEHQEHPARGAIYREVEAPVVQQERDYLGGAKLISTLAGRFVTYLNPWSNPEDIQGAQRQTNGNFERIVLAEVNQGGAGPAPQQYREVVAPAEPVVNEVSREAPLDHEGATQANGADRVKDVYGTPSRVDQVHGTPSRVDQVYGTRSRVGHVYGTTSRVDQVYGPNQNNRVEAVYNPPIDPAAEVRKRYISTTADDGRISRVANVFGPKTRAAENGNDRVEQVYGPQNQGLGDEAYIEGPEIEGFMPGQVVEVYAYSSSSHPLPWSRRLRRRMALQVFAQERRIVQIRLENMERRRPRQPMLIGNPLNLDVQHTPGVSIEKLAEIQII